MQTVSNFRKIFTLFMLFSLLMMVMNCSKSDTPTAQIIGSWKITNIFVKQGTAADLDQFPALVKALPCSKDITFAFQKTKKVTYTSSEECKSLANSFSGSSQVSAYEIKDENLIITGKSTNTFAIAFSDGKMTWTMIDGKGNAMVTTRVILGKQ